MAGLKLLACLAALGLGLGLAQENPIPGPVGSLSTETGRYIVRFSDAGSARFRKRDGSLDARSFFDALAEDVGVSADVTPVTTFDSSLFHGASFDLTNTSAEAIKELQDLPEIENIWPAAIFTVPVDTAAASVVSSGSAPSWNPHNDTGVSEAHARGFLGEGAVIAIVDTGVDYTHPALGGGFGPGFKVEAGHDFVGDSWVIGQPYAPDNDPKDCDGHGTHVAGIIASDYSEVPGVAPAARLRAYKVFGCTGGTMEDVIIAAFLKAHEDGADVINASLGSDRGFPDGPLAVAAAAIQAAGTFVSIAAGNAGARGAFFTSSGGNVLDGTTVGSIDHDELVGYVATATTSTGETREIVYLTGDSIQWKVNGTLPATVAPEYSTCRWTNAPTVKNTVLVHPRGDCNWAYHDIGLWGKMDYVFFYNFEGSPWILPARVVQNIGQQPKGFGLISYEDGKWVEGLYEQGQTISFDFVNDQRPVGVDIESFSGGRVSEFSSWGPTLDARMKPEISAPGGDIFSTFPVERGSWALFSGTSMATPYISGVAGLYLASQGGRSTLGVKAAAIARKRIVASGQPVRHTDGSDNLGSVAQQGAGLVNALKVLESTIDVSPVTINLNDTVHFAGTHDITITNQGTESATYQVHHEPGVTTHSRDAGDAWIRPNPPYSTDEGSIATADLSETAFTLGPGESKTLKATFTEPADIDAKMLPLYGGGIIISNDRGESSRVPYLGIKGSLYAADIWEMERGVPLFVDQQFEHFAPFEEGLNFTFEGGPVPMPYYNLLFSTREVSFEFVSRDWNESDWKYPVVPGENNIKGSLRTVPQGINEVIVNFPVRNMPRNSGGVYAQPTNVFAHGEDIPAGEYRLLGRALRTYGDPHNINDWQWKLSPWFRVTREKPPPPTTTSLPPTSTSSVPTVQPTRPCTEDTRRVNITVRIGTDETVRRFYRYSDFLAIDLTGSGVNRYLDFEFGPDDRVITPDAPNVTVDRFLSTHSNNNSFVYLRHGNAVTGAWSFLECAVACVDRLRCRAEGKKELYVCDGVTGLVRSGPVVLEGCQKLHLFVEELECPPAAPSAVPTVVP